MSMLDSETEDYHKRQWETPYHSTLAFSRFLRSYVRKGDVILDAGCGSGAVTTFLADEFLQANFTGIDASSEAISFAPADGMAHFKCKNLFDEKAHYSGVIGVQFLHTVHEYEKTLTHFAVINNPEWMAFSTLLYDGEIECRIQTWEAKIERAQYRNIFSVPLLKKKMKALGYGKCKYQPWEIDVDLPKPTDKNILKTWSKDGICYSGPMILPWGFIAFERDK